MSMFIGWHGRIACIQKQEILCLKRTLSSSTRRLQEQGKEARAKAPLPSSGPSTIDTPGKLQPLSRPLGVRERPTTVIKTNTQKMKDLLDRDVRMAQRRHLIKEASKGYFHDMNMTRKHGGKTWIASKVLIRDDKSLYLPNVLGKSLSDGTQKNTTELCFGKVTVLAMLGTQISELHAKSFTDATNNRFSSHPLYQYVQINLQENLLKSFLVNLFLGQLRSVIPTELHENYLISSQNMEYVREPLGMTNSKVGYVYLIDENLRIRWGGCADATIEESQALESCVGVLLKRLERKNKLLPDAVQDPGNDSEADAVNRQEARA